MHKKPELLLGASSKDKVQSPDRTFDQLLQEKWLNTGKILLMQQKNNAKLDPGGEARAHTTNVLCFNAYLCLFASGMRLYAALLSASRCGV